MKAKEAIYLTRDRQQAVDADHPDATFLLVRKGEEIPGAWAERYGIESRASKTTAPAKKKSAREEVSDGATG